MPLKLTGWTARKHCHVHIVPSADELESFNGTDAASVADAVTPSTLSGAFPPHVVYFGEIWISPAGDLVPLVVRRRGPSR